MGNSYFPLQYGREDCSPKEREKNPMRQGLSPQWDRHAPMDDTWTSKSQSNHGSISDSSQFQPRQFLIPGQVSVYPLKKWIDWSVAQCYEIKQLMLGIRLLLLSMTAARQDFAGSRNAAAATRQNSATWKTARRRRHGKIATTRQDGNGKTTRQ
jgi:hypothetical protein